MAQPLDLTGRRFGALLVIARAAPVQFGGPSRAWLCRCDCGREEVYPQDRFPHRESIAARHAVWACSECRQPACVICGNRCKWSPRGGYVRTCSTACRLARQREIGRVAYHKRAAADPDFQRERRRPLSPAAAALASERKRLQLERDPEARAKRRMSVSAHYHQNREVILAKRAERRAEKLAAMTETELEVLRARGTAATLASRRRRKALDPAAATLQAGRVRAANAKMSQEQFRKLAAEVLGVKDDADRS